MGRLTQNVLPSLAQFEREVTGERIRDKIAASKKKRMWMGGHGPVGYDLRDRQIYINPEEEGSHDFCPLHELGQRYGSQRLSRHALIEIESRRLWSATARGHAVDRQSPSPFAQQLRRIDPQRAPRRNPRRHYADQHHGHGHAHHHHRIVRRRKRP